MKKDRRNRFFVGSFLVLYALVALISFMHATDFFMIGNPRWMSVTLAFAFELGLAVCLASILLKESGGKTTMAWVLLSMLAIVQVIGNTFSVFKYISLSDTEYYQYLSKPLLFFIQDVSEDTVKIIISWIMGAILPIVALLMTGMVSDSMSIEDVQDDDADIHEPGDASNTEDDTLDRTRVKRTYLTR